MGVRAHIDHADVGYRDPGAGLEVSFALPT